MTQRQSRLSTLPVLVALLCLPTVASADEIVHFVNGAEMTVKTHAVEKDMVKLDLGGNSFIAFPMTMVDKIVSAGRDVFLNPSFHPANQAVEGNAVAGGAPGSGAVVADTSIRGGGGSVGFVRQPNAKGGAGVMLGEVADTVPMPSTDPNAQAVVNHRRAYNPGFPAPPGGTPQVIMPPSAPKAPARMTFIPRTQETPPAPPPPPPPPADSGTPDNSSQNDSDSDDPPDTP